MILTLFCLNKKICKKPYFLDNDDEQNCQESIHEAKKKPFNDMCALRQKLIPHSIRFSIFRALQRKKYQCFKKKVEKYKDQFLINS